MLAFGLRPQGCKEEIAFLVCNVTVIGFWLLVNALVVHLFGSGGFATRGGRDRDGGHDCQTRPNDRQRERPRQVTRDDDVLVLDPRRGEYNHSDKTDNS